MHQDMEHLTERCKDLSKKEAQVRLELRRNGGHGGKIRNTVLLWLEDAELVQTRFNNLSFQQESFSSRQRNVVELTHKVDCLLGDASALLVSDNRHGVDSVIPTGYLPSQPLVGQRAQKTSNKIWKCVTNPMIGTIGLYGEGGAGKSTIMKNINNQLTNADIFDRIVWVTLSKRPKNLEHMQADIGEQLNINLSEDEYSRGKASKIYSALSNLGKSLLILDDVRGLVPLKNIGIPKPTKGNGCKLVLITRFKNLCDVMRVDRKIYVKPLSEDEAWDLFVSRAGGRVWDAEINSVAKEFLNACQGRPITIITIALAMRNQITLDSWKEALRDLQATSSKLVTFGYRRLKNVVVRKCFLSCAFFPRGYRFEPNELVGYWMAEDFIHTKGDILTSINEGHEILKELIDANMLESFTDGDKEWLKMHDIFSDLAISIMEKEHGFFTTAGWRGGQNSNMYPQIFHLKPLKQAKKLSLIGKQIEKVTDVPVCYNLSTLLLTYNPLSYISPTLFNGLPNLQVLDMSNSGIKRLPPSLSRLVKLRVLRLQYCTSLKKISSLENLKKLEVLNIRGTLIKELPEGIENLVKLRSLDLSETVRLKYIKDGVISSLSNLQELQMQGSHLCQMESLMIANCLKEIRCLEQLEILTLGGVGFEDHLDTILHLQSVKRSILDNLKKDHSSLSSTTGKS